MRPISLCPKGKGKPNLASRNHSGISFDGSASTEPSNGPLSMPGWAEAFQGNGSEGAPASADNTLRVSMFMGVAWFPSVRAACIGHHGRNRNSQRFRSEEHTSELQSLRHLGC